MSKVKPFTCNVCKRAFSLRGNLNVHLRTHTGEKPFLCDICGSAFSLKHILQQHQLCHTGEKPVSCGTCGKSFQNKEAVRRHQVVHTRDKQFVCGICSKAFTSCGNLRQHRRIHLKERPYVCRRCGVALSRKTSLRKHVKKFHLGGKPVHCNICGRTIPPENVVETLLWADARMEEFVCGFCDDPVQKRKRLMNQLHDNNAQDKVILGVANKEACPCDNLEKTNKALGLEVDSRTESCSGNNGGDVTDAETHGPTDGVNTGEADSQEMDSDTEHHCGDAISETPGPEADSVKENDYRDKAGEISEPLPKTKNLPKCQVVPSGNRKSKPNFQQEIAARDKSSASNLFSGGKSSLGRKKHADGAKVHSRGLFVCDKCSKAFTIRGNLEAHRRIHTGERPFVCDYCGRTFPLKQRLQNHQLCHTGERPYLCYICGKSYRYGKSLRDHQRTHTGEKPLICKVCGKAFSNSGNFSQHRKIHTKEKPYVCSTCRVVFSRRASLRKHIKKFHVGGKQFNCAGCGNAASQESVVENLLGTSTAIKVFMCETCEKPI